MSRHSFAGKAGTTVAIGWDRPLATFFVHVSRPDPSDEDETETIVWEGTARGELPSAAAAIAIAAPYADLPSTLGATLETDRMKTLGAVDGPAQRAAKPFLDRT
jgi:hypothetical protein